MSESLFTPSGGYRRLHSFAFATMIHLGTVRFCRRFVPFQEDPLGKTSGQMIGAARSGRQNIVEGSERAATSRETEIKLTDVARASLMELLGDYECFLADRDSIPWSNTHPDSQALQTLTPPEFVYTDDTIHDYWLYYRDAEKLFARWLDSDDPIVVANAMLILLSRTTGMLGAQIRSLGDSFVAQGGFRERMRRVRVETRVQEGPACPRCGGVTYRRASKSGSAFWGCGQYPACKGTLDISAKPKT